MKEWNVVDLLGQSRHDWLNKLQLIKGNLSLNRIERAKEIIEEIVIETQNEAKLTNLQLQELAGYLLTYNWDSHHFFLEFEVLGTPVNLSKYDRCMQQWCEQFFSILDKSVSAFGENHLSISIQPLHTEVRFFFDFSGTIKDTSMLNEWLQKNNWNKSILLTNMNVTEVEMTVELQVK
jgi:stage 0 sporulation protein B (sporulation initiation phosphotransferase)